MKTPYDGITRESIDNKRQFKNNMANIDSFPPKTRLRSVACDSGLDLIGKESLGTEELLTANGPRFAHLIRSYAGTYGGAWEDFAGANVFDRNNLRAIARSK